MVAAMGLLGLLVLTAAVIGWYFVPEEVMEDVICYGGLVSRPRHWHYGQSYEHQKMNKINYKSFILEAVNITAFCLIATYLFKLLGASNNTLLILFNMAVMSAATTFSIEKNLFSNANIILHSQWF